MYVFCLLFLLIFPCDVMIQKKLVAYTIVQKQLYITHFRPTISKNYKQTNNSLNRNKATLKSRYSCKLCQIEKTVFLHICYIFLYQ